MTLDLGAEWQRTALKDGGLALRTLVLGRQRNALGKAWLCPTEWSAL